MLAFAALAVLLAAPEPYKVDPHVGNSNFSAVFDAPLGERINAISSKVSCDLSVDDASGMASGSCSVPLVSIMVDNEPIKAEHFQQWSTNKKSKPKACSYEAKLDPVQIKLEANKDVPFTTTAAFTVCGRGREDGAKETLEGTAMLMPPGSYGEAQTLRVRAKVVKFDREAYHIGPKWTDGWLARVQQLGPVVSPTGTIDFSIFARKVEVAKAGDKAAKKK